MCGLSRIRLRTALSEPRCRMAIVLSVSPRATTTNRCDGRGPSASAGGAATAAGAGFFIDAAEAAPSPAAGAGAGDAEEDNTVLTILLPWSGHAGRVSTVVANASSPDGCSAARADAGRS